ncbi:MAG: hypothetical protein LBK92_03915 [Endomicrobium sp.]|jgi:hypothetical protein|nr:hypothetical protein [Endomicrobium sp.]
MPLKYEMLYSKILEIEAIKRKGKERDEKEIKRYYKVLDEVDRLVKDKNINIKEE